MQDESSSRFLAPIVGTCLRRGLPQAAGAVSARVLTFSCPIVLTFLAFAGAQRVVAADLYWNNVAGGIWSTGNNWETRDSHLFRRCDRPENR